MNKRFALALAFLLAACGSGGPPPADWKMNAVSLMDHAQARWLEGDAKAAELAQKKVREEIARSGRIDLLARAELAACATKLAALDFSQCSAFTSLERDSTKADQAYAKFMNGDWSKLDATLLPTHYRSLVAAKEDGAALSAAQAIPEPLPRLIGLAVLFKQARIQPLGLADAIETASERGWRRPLLAWLEVARQRALAAGDQDAAAHFSRRIALVSGQEAKP
jgi:hypothetical protein